MEITAPIIMNNYDVKINDFFYIKKINDVVFVIDKLDLIYILNGEAFFSYLNISFDFYNETKKRGISFQHPCGAFYSGCQCKSKSFSYLFSLELQENQIYKVTIKHINKSSRNLTDFFDIKKENNIVSKHEDLEIIDLE